AESTVAVRSRGDLSFRESVARRGKSATPVGQETVVLAADRPMRDNGRYCRIHAAGRTPATSRSSCEGGSHPRRHFAAAMIQQHTRLDCYAGSTRQPDDAAAGAY